MTNRKQFLSTVATTVISGLLVAGMVMAVTTISENIVTGGALTIGGTFTLENSETIVNSTDGTFGFSDGTTTVSLRPALTGASTSVLTMGTSAAKLDFSSMTGSNSGASIYLTASAADAQVKGLDVSVTDTGSTGTNYLRALNLRLTKTAGVADLDGSESYMWGINNEVALSGGTILNVWGDVTGVNITGTPTVGALLGSPNQVAAIYAKSYIATGATLNDVLDAPIIASVIDGATARKKADAAVIAVLRGGSSQANTAGAAFKVMDMVSEADQSGSNFDYGLDLYFVDNGAGRGYANVFVTADIRLSNSATIDNTTDGTLTITEPTIDLVGALTADAVTLSDVLTFSDAATIDNTDASTLTLTETTVAIAGNGTVSGTLGVTGMTTLSGTSKLISAGSYGSKLDITEGSTVEMVTIAGETTEDDFLIGYGSYLSLTGENGKGFGASYLVEAKNTTGTPTLQGLQSMAFLGTVGGSEAAVLKTMGGDATAGMYGGWFKVGANSNAVAASGSRVAPLWVDSQMSGTISGEEYGIFASTGASQPDAFVGFETTSSGYDALFYFDETAYDQEPVVDGDIPNTVLSPASDKYLRVNVNGVIYGIPLYNTE